MPERDDLDGELSARSRELFLTNLWSLLVDEDEWTDGSPSWIEQWMRGTPPGSVPAFPTAAALHRILACGVDPDDLTDVVRTMQHEVVYDICQLLDDPTLLGLPAESSWELTAVRTAPPVGRSPMYGLHSGLDELDPSGRGGEPRPRPVPARLPGQPLYARIAVAQARAGDRHTALKTWRTATGATLAEAKAALDALLEQP
ncbi:hypothetical protein [Krasilnikovia sp. M28-CT-15]|uniref:hypothetical protein n=1 Tax=Krasilnikovia sp. M28-CT-15 TaxID=3373540 RepID=UPI003876B1F4